MLHGVLWAYRTASKRSMGETPFSLIYGTKALRFAHTIELSNDEALRTNQDMVKERRDLASIGMDTQTQCI